MNNNTEGVKHRRRRVSDGFSFGLYVWQMEDGKILGDSEGSVLNVPSRIGDLEKMAALSNYVRRELGIVGGKPKFLEGTMRLSEDEHDDQLEQMLNGEVPAYDLGSLKDDIRRQRKNG